MQVAIIGSGKIGATLARRLTETGHEVTLANSRGPDIARAARGRARPACARGARHRRPLRQARRRRRARRTLLPLRPAAAGGASPARSSSTPRTTTPAATATPRAAGRQHDVERADRRAPAGRSRRQGVQHDGLDPARRGRPPRRRSAIGSCSSSRATTRTPRPPCSALADDIGFDTIDHGGSGRGPCAAARLGRLRRAHDHCAQASCSVLRMGGRGNKQLALLAAIMGSFVAGLDATAVNVALPAIRDDLGGGLAGQQWVSNAYLLTLGSLILVGGSLGDIFGERRVFSTRRRGLRRSSRVLCALAPTIEFLIAGRALQGAFGALLTPSALALIIVDVPGRRARRGDRLVDGLVGHRDGDRPARRRLARRRGLVAADLRDQRPVRDRSR